MIDVNDYFSRGARSSSWHRCAKCYALVGSGELHICKKEPAANDPVNHPEHYQTADGIECIDAIAAALTPEQFAGFCRGNALKYLWRAGKKGSANEDLDKAIWYLERMKSAS